MGEQMEVESAAKENGNSEVELTETENELYDRQIRLWGLESQKRLRTAKVLISGLNGMGAEVTKNIILSGVHAVKLNDSKIVTEEDFCSQFLLPRTALGCNRAEASIERSKALNPMVEISADIQPLSEKNEDFFCGFDVVVVIGASNNELLRIDDICRRNDIKFFAGDVWGMFGYIFADLKEHKFVEDVVKHKIISKPNEKTKTELITTTVQKELSFPSYQAFVDFDMKNPAFQKNLKRKGPAFVLLRVLQKFRESFCRDPSYKSREEDLKHLESLRDEFNISGMIMANNYLEYIFAQISPAAAVVGGVMAQEIIKTITKKESPNLNLFLFDPQTCCGFIETIGVY
ncbi:SUMO-activating enzyme subunit 1 [Stomoxys calcitrans]|uniref:SUMO-activating enzyme subunit 1 n=1 Tax=Stomoxys calcitrans TaxID=35570 RepID=A0A1I8PPC1_STOCA|nr:SUMO-activating enzyme subunit 1 [Stomoxys calcitrans]